MDGQTLVNLGLVLVFVLVGGVFAATEIALVSLRESQLTQLERQGSRGARVAAVARDPNRFLAAVQIGVTVSGFFSAAYGGSTLAPDLAPSLEVLGLGADTAETAALIAMTLLIAYLSLVLGELVPKRLALQRAAGLSQAVAPVLDRFALLMRPVIWLLSTSTDLLVRLLGGDPRATTEQLSEEELRELVSSHEALDEQERTILRDVLQASDTTVKEVMRPRGDVEFLAAATPIGTAAARIRELPYSRYPVTGQGFDDVVGYLHVRDLLGLEADDARTVGDLARPVLALPATNLVLPSVATMRQEGTHLAVVVDEYGGTDGIVTLEDLVEELIGEVRDEHDLPDACPATPGADDVLDAGLTLEDFGEVTGVELEDGDYETVAGFVIAQLGRFPEEGEQVEVEGAVLEVVRMAGHRVVEVAVRRS
jgi:putative hemolysin